MNRTRRLLQFSALTVAFAGLLGCGDRASAPDVAPVPVLTEAEANARRVVPLTRTVSLANRGVVADFEFDLPPPDPSAVPDLTIGFRLEAKDAKALRDESGLILREGLPAAIRLTRLDITPIARVPLSRDSSDRAKQLALTEDGRVPGVTATSVDNSMLRGAGLSAAGKRYQILMLAHAEDLAPGRYHVSVELLENQPSMRLIDAQLIIAYSYRAK